MLSGQNTGYLMERDLGMLKRIQFIGNRYQVIHDPSEVPEEITKVSVYLHEGVESYTERFVPRWKEANCAVAGPYWIDTTFANKGIGVRSICKTLDIDLADVMAFGDNYNDVSMLDIVGVPYIMDGAAAPLREKYPNHTPRPGCAAGVLEASVNLERARSKFEMIRYKLHGSAGRTALTGEFYDRALL